MFDFCRCICSAMFAFEPGFPCFNLAYNLIAFGIAATDLLHSYEIIIYFSIISELSVKSVPFDHGLGLLRKQVVGQ